MSGINDDVEEGLEPYVTPLDENSNQPDAPKVNLVTKTEDAEPSDNDINAIPTNRIFGGPLTPGELPNLDAEFTIITDQENTVSDMLGMRESVSSSCGVCQEDVNGFNSLSPGFVNNGRPIGFYTEAKSKTQFSQTLNNMDASIEVGIEELVGQAIAVNEKLIPVFNKLSKGMLEAITKNQTKAHLVHSEMVLLRAIDPNAEVQMFLQELQKPLPRRLELENDLPARLQQWASVISIPDNSANIRNLVQGNRVNTLTGIQIGGEVYAFSDQEPYLVVPDSENNDRFDRGADFADYFHNGIDMVSIAYLQRLCQVSVNLTQAMAASSQALTDLAKNPTANLKERLDTVTKIVAINQKYARQNAYLLSFMTDYFAVYDSMVQTALDLKGKQTV